MRNRFNEQLLKLNDSLIEMGEQVEHSISMSVKALIDRNGKLAQKTIDFDEQINKKEKEIESMCLNLLLRQQPIARDLRLVSSALKMITDMERIGDQSADISEISIRLPEEQNIIDDVSNISLMAKEVKKMLKDAVNAFVKKDLALAKEVILYDDVVDDLFYKVRKELITLLRQNDNLSEQAIDFIMVAKYLERIGDHIVNIANWVVFSITGKHKYK